MGRKKNKVKIDTGNNLVYSTNPKIQPKINASEPAALQKLRVRLEKNGRGGKQVTLVYGFVGNDKDLSKIEKMLKSHCGTGGSSKHGEILIQGDHVQKVIQKLQDSGYTQTKKGGG